MTFSIVLPAFNEEGNIASVLRALTDELRARQTPADIIVVNDVSAPGVGFEFDTNEVLILGADGSERHVPLTGKRSVAVAVLDAVVSNRPATASAPPSGEKT